MDTQVIICWSHPRSCSTMLERTFLSRAAAAPGELHVLHEPMGDVFYYGKERCSPRFDKPDHPEHGELTFDECWANVTQPSRYAKSGQKAPKIFSKDMAQYIIRPPIYAKTTPQEPDEKGGNPTLIPTDKLLDPRIKHTFLIRTPRLAVPSYYRLCSGDKCEVTGFHYFDPDEVGLKESRLLYNYLASKQDVPPLVIDAEDLLAEPAKVLQRYCEYTGVPFDEGMLEWEASQPKEFEKWKGWHEDAEKSSGIGRPQTPHDKTKKAKEVKAMPDLVHKAIEDSLADYEYLKSKALKV